MVKIKNARSILNYLAFTAFLTIGVGLSIFVQEVLTKDPALTPTAINLAGIQSQTPIQPTTPNNQLNLIVIGVDRVSPQEPRVIAIWLASYLTRDGFNILTFKPIYPLLSDHPASNTEELLASFEISEELALSDAFKTELERKTWFDGYVLLDEIAMIELVDLVISGTPKMPAENSVLLIGSIHLPWQNLSTAYHDQVGLVEWLCGRLPAMKANTPVGKILELQIQQHLSTDMDMETLIQTWKQVARQGQLPQCQVNP